MSLDDFLQARAGTTEPVYFTAGITEELRQKILSHFPHARLVTDAQAIKLQQSGDDPILFVHAPWPPMIAEVDWSSPEEVGLIGTSVDEMLQWMSRVAEKKYAQAARIPDPPDPVIRLTWVVCTADGRAALVYTPKTEDREDSAINDAMRSFLIEHHAVRYAIINEMWIGGGDDLRPSQDPNRRECVRLYVVDVSGERALAWRQIIRPQHGSPYLGDLNIADGKQLDRLGLGGVGLLAAGHA